MSKSGNYGKRLDDPFFLYELSLSIGTTLDLKAACAEFIKILLARPDLSFASVWIKNKYLAEADEKNGASLIYACPDSWVGEIHVPLSHHIFRSLRGKKYLSRTSSESGYEKISSGKGIRSGTFALFSLKDLGAIKLFSATRKERFGEEELSRLERVISKFAGSLECCLDHQRVRGEILEHRQVKEALQISEARYRSFFEDSPISLWEEDFSRVKTYLDGLWKKKPSNLRRYFDKHPETVAECARRVIIVAVNKATLKMYEARNLAELRRGLSQVFTEESYEAFKEELIALSEGKEHFQAETLNRTLEGERRHISITIGLMPGYEETWSRRLVSIVDISDRKLAEEALRHSEERFRVLAEKSPNMIFVNQGGKVAYANRKCEEAMGYGRAEFYAPDFDFRTLISPEYHQVILAALEKHRRGEEVEPYHYALITKSGERIEAIIATKLIQYKGGPAILGIVTDITELKQAEEKLRESEEKYRIFVERANDGILIVQDGLIKYANPRLGEMSGYEVERLVGSVFTDYVHSDEVPNVVDHYRRRLLGEKVEPVYETVLKHKDGSNIYAEINAGTIAYQGKTGVLVFLRDITERKEMEAELSRASKLESLGIMAGGIAHDFNNILTGILGNISLARLALDSGNNAADRLMSAERATLRAKNLTQQLLTFSKGGFPVKEAVSVSEFLEETIRFSLSGANVTCNVSLADDIQPVFVDVAQIKQVVENLIINSVQAMPEGGTITVVAQNFGVSQTAHLSLKEGEYVKLSLSDTGRGIKAEHLDKVFDPFFTTKHKGSGLGLASAYSIVRNHDGAITVESQLGEGTTFSIYLPASSAEPAGRREKEFNKKFSRHTGEVLIVDDEAMVRDVAKGILELIGYRPTLAADGRKGIELYEAALKEGCRYDAVLLDLTMPGGMGGKEVAAKIRAIDRQAKLIATSGYATDPVIANFEKFGFDAALAKPYQMEELSNVLEKVTGCKNSGVI